MTARARGSGLMKESIIAIVLWLSAVVGVVVSLTIPIVVSEELVTLPPEIADLESARFHPAFWVDKGSSTINYRFRFWPSLAVRDEIRKLSADSEYVEVVDQLFADRHWLLWYAIPGGWLFCVVIFEAYHLITKGRRRSLQEAFDYRVVLAFFAFTCLFTFFLFQVKMFSTSVHRGGFWEARVEFFLTWGVFLAIVGAFYAVFAKRRADASFLKGQEIYQAITSFFTNYESIMDPRKERSIPGLIEGSQKSLTFFLGSPLVGYFRDERLGNAFYLTLLAKVNAMQQQPGQQFRIEFLCWSDESCTYYYPKGETPAARQVRADFAEKRNTLLRAIERLGDSRGRVFHPQNNQDSVFRFVIADEKDVIFWLLEEATPAAAKRERAERDPKGGGFMSDREEMVRILKNLFERIPKDQRRRRG